MGIICFRVNRIGSDNRLVAKNRKWYKWFCLISRIVMSCAVFTLVIQFWYGERVVDLVNRFLRLFQRIHALPGCQDVGFGDKWVLILLLLKVISRIYESCYLIPVMMPLLDSYHISTTICDFYNTVNASIILHFTFVAYLSIGTAYDQVNSFVRHELRQQLCELNSSHGFSVSRRKLKAVGHCLDECLAIYDEIAQLGNAYHRLFEFPLCIFLSYGFLSLATIAFIITLNLAEGIRLWLLTIQILLDILLLTTAVHIASSNSRNVQRLSLENYYVSVHKDWHMKVSLIFLVKMIYLLLSYNQCAVKALEMFLCRLNYNEFRVRPLGLFEVSNQLILVFLSALATYLTYIIQVQDMY
ncbi:uncharacterized protein Dmoj_GI22858 [Drosophila mojavensis]|uniref:Gustatory receptor n=1 Tax=Drosophila mojavensis TaxID=7230 RepID=B4K707_DROMO|nr:uncharacterized protein Dmoj_GI22858 [Drosophila mojavensis]